MLAVWQIFALLQVIIGLRKSVGILTHASYNRSIILVPPPTVVYVNKNDTGKSLFLLLLQN